MSGQRVTSLMRKVPRSIHGRTHLWIVRHFRKRLAMLRGSKAVISFTFDDFPRSAYRLGGEILREYGARGTYYVSMGLAGTETVLGPQFTLSDLENATAEGHELGCHTFGHLIATTTPAEEYEASIIANREHVRRVLPSVELESFAYPRGRVSLGAKRVTGRRFASCRATFAGINSGMVDLNRLASIALYMGRMTADQLRMIITERIAAAIAQRGWLIFHTHDVCDEPSPFGCTPEILDAAVKAAADSEADVLPVTEALRSVLDDASGAAQKPAGSSS